MRTIRLVGTLYRETLECLQIAHEKLQAKNRRLRKRIAELASLLQRLKKCTCTRSWPRSGHHDPSECHIALIEKVMKGDT